jgi:hypothetical protein
MARGPLLYIILYTYSLLSLDRGWGPQSVAGGWRAAEGHHKAQRCVDGEDDLNDPIDHERERRAAKRSSERPAHSTPTLRPLGRPSRRTRQAKAA